MNQDAFAYIYVNSPIIPGSTEPTPPSETPKAAPQHNAVKTGISMRTKLLGVTVLTALVAIAGKILYDWYYTMPAEDGDAADLNAQTITP